jgi:hypothetical protein
MVTLEWLEHEVELIHFYSEDDAAVTAASDVLSLANPMEFEDIEVWQKAVLALAKAARGTGNQKYRACLRKIARLGGSHE